MARVALLPGDGIGPEVIDAAARVLARVRPDVESQSVTGRRRGAGSSDCPRFRRRRARFASAATPFFSAASACRSTTAKPLAERPEYALFLLRRDYELYANLRPVRVFPGLEDASSLRAELVRGLDLIVVRELTGGIYFGQPKEQRVTDGVEEAVDTMIYRAPEVERIARMAFEAARARRKHLTSVDKQNILETSRLWRRVVERVSGEYPDVHARPSARRQRGDAARAPSG